MGFDSTADLLFKIGADSSDAQGNIARFRGLLSKDLGAMKGDFSDWATQVFGKLETVKGAMVALTSVAAAGALALGTALLRAAEKAAQFAGEIEDGMDKTGLSAEEMSKLRFAAEQTGLQYGSLVSALVKFERVVVEAAASGEKYRDTFGRLGISQEEVKRGTETLLPLLMRTADAYKLHGSVVEKSAMAQALFSRGGAELLEFLGLGSEGIKLFGDRAKDLGRVLSEENVLAAKAFQMASQELEAQLKAVGLVVGIGVLPVLREFSAIALGLIATLKKDTGGLTGELKGLWALISFSFIGEIDKAREHLDKALAAATAASGRLRITLPEPPEKPAKKVKQPVAETIQEYYGLSSIVETIRGQMAGLEGDEARIFAQAEKFRFAMQKAEEEFFQRLPKLDLASFEREFDDLRAIPGLIGAWTDREMGALAEKLKQAAISATEDLEGRLVGLREQSYENQRAAAEREIALLISKYQREKDYTKTNAKLIEQIRAGMLGNIDREQAAAFQNVLGQLKQDYDRYATARMTSYERLRFAYDEDVRRFSWAEEQKALALATSIEQMAIIINRFGQLRKMALNQYGNDLTSLYNSQGWQGVFGEAFARNIRGNEELLRQWSESANQSTKMLEVSIANLGAMAIKYFDQWAQATSANIAAAIVWRKSIGEAVRQATAETLQQLASECYYLAIMASAKGFMALASWNFDSAAKYFTAAGLFAAVGTGAAVTGRAIAPKQGGAGAAGGAGEGVSGGASQTSAQGAQEVRRPQVNVYIQGPIVGRYGIDELAEIINDAVQGRDVKLISSGTLNNTRLRR